jgi:hypothetical protein
MKYNEMQSPLLRPPAEISNKIFRMVVGDQHVHISVSHLPKKPAEDAELPTFTMKERAPKWPRSWEAAGHDNRYHEHQRRFQPWKNDTYLLDWRAHYTTQPVKENKEIKYLCEMVPEKRIVWASGSHMIQLSQVCRQIYDEVGLSSTPPTSSPSAAPTRSTSGFASASCLSVRLSRFFGWITSGRLHSCARRFQGSVGDPQDLHPGVEDSKQGILAS